MPQDANTVVDSSPAAEEVQDSGIDLADLSAEQYDAFMLHGTMPEAKPAETATQPPKTIETPEESGKSKGNQEAGKGKGIKERLPQLDSEIQELEARLARKADLKRQLESDSGDKTAPPPVTETKSAELKAPVKPKVDDFKTWDEYETARDKFFEDLSDYKVAKAIQEDRAQRAEEATREKQQAEGKARAEGWNKRVDVAAKAHDDWDAVIGPIEAKLKSPAFAAGSDLIVEHEMGAEVLHYLGSNLDEFEKILAMRPTAQAAAIGVIAHSLTKPAESVKKTPPGPKKVTETPPPPSELAGRNQLSPDPVRAALEADDMEAYMEAANARDIADIAAGRRRSGL